MKRLLLALLCVFLSGAVLAAGPAAVRKRVQASMLVTGTIDVALDGSVQGYVVDQSDKLPAPVVALIEKGERTWKFEPVLQDGKPVLAKAKMSLRIVAKPVADKDYSLSIAGAQFGTNAPGETVSYKQTYQPIYPRSAVDARVSGTVYLLLLVGPQGQVENIATEQVNLGVVGSDMELNHWRRVLADAAMSAIKRTTFNLPTVGEQVAAGHWLARIPASFELHERGQRSVEPEYGTWVVYVPGPRQRVPWLDSSHAPSGNDVDALAAGKIQLVGVGLHLITPLGGT